MSIWLMLMLMLHDANANVLMLMLGTNANAPRNPVEEYRAFYAQSAALAPYLRPGYVRQRQFWAAQRFTRLRWPLFEKRSPSSYMSIATRAQLTADNLAWKPSSSVASAATSTSTAAVASRIATQGQVPSTSFN